MEAPDTVVVDVLVSSEKPMEATGCDEHGVAVALSATGEVTAAPLAGLVTLTAANAGPVKTIVTMHSGMKVNLMYGTPVFTRTQLLNVPVWLAERKSAYAAHGLAGGSCQLNYRFATNE